MGRLEEFKRAKEAYANKPPENSLLERYFTVRQYSEFICEPLVLEDYVVQPVADVSPPKWHLAHTSWFFEELLLSKYLENYQRFQSTLRFPF